MENKVRMALAVGAGYCLGRTRKMRWALALAGVGASRQLPKDPAALLVQGTRLLGSSPEAKALAENVSGRLSEAGRAAAITAVNGRLDALSERLHQRAETMLQENEAEEPETEQAEAEEPGGEEPEPEKDEAEEPEAEAAESEPEKDEAEEPEAEAEEAEEPEAEKAEPAKAKAKARAKKAAKPVKRRAAPRRAAPRAGSERAEESGRPRASARGTGR